MVRSLLFYGSLLIITVLRGQSFTQTIGGFGAQDGVGAMSVASGFIVGVREYSTAEPHYGLLYSMDSNGGLSSATAVDIAQTAFLQGLCNVPNGSGYVFGSMLDSTDGLHDALIVKLDDAGNTLWTRTLEGPGSHQYFAAYALSDGGAILCGVVNVGDGHDVLVARHDVGGELLWSYVHPSSTDAEGYGITVEGTNVIVTGRLTTFSGHSDVLFLHLDLNGSLVNSTAIGGALDEVGRAIVSLENGTFVIAGKTNSFGVFDISSQSRQEHAYLLCVDLDGDTLWTRALGDTVQGHTAFAIQRATNGDLLIAGERTNNARSDALFARYTSSGDELWTRTLDVEKEDRLVHILPMPDGGFVGTGWSFGPFGRQLLFIRRNSEGF